MFEGLKKKFSHFVDSLVKNERKEQEAGKGGREAVAKEEKAEGISPSLTASTKIKGALFRKVRIGEADTGSLIEDLRRSLLEADVSYDTTEKIAEDIRKRLVGAEVDSKDMKEQINEIIKGALLDILNSGAGVDIVKMATESKGRGEPFKILFLGPNGAGKTTTIAKIAKMLMQNGISCVLSASDTFRAAAIEQTAHHAGKLGIGVIKGAYGSDPASVAFDAIAFARAHGVNAVLIDSAGRQETNKSLMEEVKKMARVAKPDVKIFVGEGIAGNALPEQIKEFDNAVKLDGIILTKVDCDAKGGNTLSVLSETKVPVLFFGTGEAYDAITKYSPDFIIRNIFAS